MNLFRQCLRYLLLLCTVSVSFQAHGQPPLPDYAFVSGLIEDYNVEVFNLNSDGTISLRSRFDYSSYAQKMLDSWDFYISPKGDFAMVNDGNRLNGMLYSIDSKLAFHFIKEINGGCIGLGFAQDGEYCFSSTGFDSYIKRPQIRIFKVNGGKFDLARTQDVPSTTTLGDDIFCTAEDEVMASSLNGYVNSYFNFSIYQFDRKTETLQLKQHFDIPDVNIVFADATPDRRLIVYGQQRHIGSLARQTDGSYKRVSDYFRDEWEHGEGAWGMRIRNDGKYAVANVFDADTWEPPAITGGPALFTVKPNGEMEYKSQLIRYAGGAATFTPDGRLCVVSYDFGKKIEVLKINEQTNTLEHISEYTHSSPGIRSIRFLPQVRPATPVKEKNWSLYGDASHPSPKIAQNGVTEN